MRCAALALLLLVGGCSGLQAKPKVGIRADQWDRGSYSNFGGLGSSTGGGDHEGIGIYAEVEFIPDFRIHRETNTLIRDLLWQMGNRPGPAPAMPVYAHEEPEGGTARIELPIAGEMTVPDDPATLRALAWFLGGGSLMVVACGFVWFRLRRTKDDTKKA